MRLIGLCAGLLFAAVTALGCSSDPTTPPMPPPSTFKEVKPCATEGAYQSGSSIEFTNVMYTPKCLKVAKGATVTFKAAASMSFTNHPLAPSKKLGDTPNPIPAVTTGETKEVAFPAAGFFAYYCTQHGFLDNGADGQMNGVVWVQ